MQGAAKFWRRPVHRTRCPHDVSMGQVARRKRTHHARRGTYDLLTGEMYRAPPVLVLENLTMTSATKMPRTHQSGSS